MKTDTDYWKRRYRGLSWETASDKEKKVAASIKDLTGKDVVPVGLGACSSEYLAGAAQSHGHELGGADLHVVGTNLYIEVTGPQQETVTERDPLWLRPDKIANAKAHPERETWVVHWLQRSGLLRVIRLDQDFFGLVSEGVLKILTISIRGTRETYLEIPAEASCVRHFGELLTRVRAVNPWMSD